LKQQKATPCRPARYPVFFLRGLRVVEAAVFRGLVCFFGLGGGGFGSKMVGWPSTIG
jgi:hypothetical protein